VRFFVGLHQPSDAWRFNSSFISINRLRSRKSSFRVNDWIMDSGAFKEVSTHGHYRYEVCEYAEQIVRWKDNGNMLAAVSQDYMCEPFILDKTRMTVLEHQQLTIARYDELLRYETGCYIMPVLQGFAPFEYVKHVQQYGDKLAPGAWVGVGSVCKRNSDPLKILRVLAGIKHVRPDLRLHGFGLKMTALAFAPVRELLHSADSMAWSYHARMHGRGGNHWSEAKWMVDKVQAFIEGREPPSYSTHLETMCK